MVAIEEWVFVITRRIISSFGKPNVSNSANTCGRVVGVLESILEGIRWRVRRGEVVCQSI